MTKTTPAPADSADTLNPLKRHKDSLLGLAPAAIAVLRELLNSDSDKVRLDASKAILDRAGLLPAADRDKKTDRNLAEIPIADLRRMADRLEGELAARALPIAASVDAAPVASQKPSAAHRRAFAATLADNRRKRAKQSTDILA